MVCYANLYKQCSAEKGEYKLRHYALVTLVIVAIIGNSGSAKVFHGKDPETGAMIYRASVDTITPPKSIEIGLQIVHIHDTGVVTIAFTSFDDKLKDLDTSSAVLIVDNQRIALTFKAYHALIISKDLPPIHQLWFAPLNGEMVVKIKEAQRMSIEISTISGIPMKRDLSTLALSDVKEVIRGDPTKQ